VLTLMLEVIPETREIHVRDRRSGGEGNLKPGLKASSIKDRVLAWGGWFRKEADSIKNGP